MQDAPRHGVSDVQHWGGGTVTVHRQAAIAPDVHLLAAVGCRLTIAEGACIGRGSVLQAMGGDLEVQTDATLGAAVLLIGSGKIGAQACVGAMTTIYNPNIAAGDAIPAGSLCLAELDCSELEAAVESAAFNGSPNPGVTNATQSVPLWNRPSHPAGMSNVSAPNLNHLSTNESLLSLPPASAPVYGKVEFYRLLAMLFPHREALMAEWAESQQSADHPRQGES